MSRTSRLQNSGSGSRAPSLQAEETFDMAVESGLAEYGYHDVHPTWDHSIVLTPISEALRSLPPDGSVLDIGCGNGAMLAEMRKLGPWRFFGVEGSESGVEMARKQGFDTRLADSSRDLLTVFATERFDLIVCVEVIEHVYNPRGLLRQAHALLRPNGRLLLTTPYHGYLKNLLIAASGKCDSHYGPLWDGGHIKFWSRKTLSTALDETGFTNVRFHGAGRVPYLWKSMVMTARRP
jgi:2-polyprenyl-3-methyl-5-hydroxy-6-metoxy-1,4-benzoquinol methylase